jgi:ankyrin repeat protein
LILLTEDDPTPMTGVSVNARDPACRGATALHFAAGKGHQGPLRRLLKYGADPNARTDDGHTAMHWAASMG